MCGAECMTDIKCGVTIHCVERSELPYADSTLVDPSSDGEVDDDTDRTSWKSLDRLRTINAALIIANAAIETRTVQAMIV